MNDTTPTTNDELKREHGIEKYINALGDYSEFMLTHNWPLMFSDLQKLREKNPLSLDIYTADMWEAATKAPAESGQETQS